VKACAYSCQHRLWHAGIGKFGEITLALTLTLRTLSITLVTLLSPLTLLILTVLRRITRARKCEVSRMPSAEYCAFGKLAKSAARWTNLQIG